MLNGERMHLPVNLSWKDKLAEKSKATARLNAFLKGAVPSEYVAIRPSHIPGDVFESRDGRRYMVGRRGNWVRQN